MQVQSWHDYASDEKAVRPVKTGTRVKFVHVIKQQHFVRIMFVMREKELKKQETTKFERSPLTQSQISPDTFFLNMLQVQIS